MWANQSELKSDFFRGIELLWNSISENSRKRGFELDASTMETFV